LAGAGARLRLPREQLGDGLTSAFFDWLSKWLDIPVLSKSIHPRTRGASPSSRGFARIEVLVALAIGLLPALVRRPRDDPPRAVPVHALVAESESVPTPPPAEPQFGGCVKAGKLCFGPSVAMTVAAINLKTKAIEALLPRCRATVHAQSGEGNSLGADAFFTLDPRHRRPPPPSC